MKKNVRYSFISACLLGLVPGLVVAETGAGAFSYEGRIYDASGDPSIKKVNLILRVMSPDKTCVLREESTGLIDLNASSGYFSVSVGDGSRGPNDPGLSLAQVFTNGKLAVGKKENGETCNVTGTAGSGRYLRVLIDDNGSVTPMEPDVPIGTSPYAVVADTAGSVDGFNASHLLRVENSGLPGTAPALTSAHAGELVNLLDGASTLYMKNSSGGGAALPSYPTLTPPASPQAGSVWYDSDAKAIKFFDGTNPVTLGSGGGSGTVTSVTAGDGLAGGTFTVSGTISLNDIGTAGTYYKVTTDAKGRVTSGLSSLAESDIPTISTPGKVSGVAITSGEISGTTSINTSGGIATTGAVASGSFSTRLFDLYDSDNSHRIRFQTPATGDLINDYILTWPENAGSNGQVLTTNGAGVLSWTTVSGGGGGSVSDVTASAPLISSGGTIPHITIPPASVSADGYLSQSDWSRFDSKLSSSLDYGQIWVGNVFGQAAAVTPNGDVVMDSSSGSFTVTHIRGQEVATAPAASSGQVLRYDASLSRYEASFLSLADIRSTTTPFNPMFPNTSCTANQTLNWSSLTDTMSCTTILISDSAVIYGDKPANQVLAGPMTGSDMTPTFRSLVAADLPSNLMFESAVMFGTSDPLNLILKTNNLDRMIVNQDGFVGIGEFTPAAKLHVSDTRTDMGSARIPAGKFVMSAAPSSGGATFVGSESEVTSYQSGGFNGSVVASYNTARNNGSGSPSGLKGVMAYVENLAPSGSVNNTMGVHAYLKNDSSSTTIANAYGIQSDVVNVSGTMTTAVGLFTQISKTGGSINNAYGVKIGMIQASGAKYSLHASDPDASSFFAGNVGIGTSNPAAKLHIYDGEIKVSNGVTSCEFGVGGSGGACSSDMRLKTNIQEIPGALEKVSSLRGVSYDWNEVSGRSGEPAIGVIAQEVEAIFPTAVTTDKSTGYKRVDYAVLVAPLIQAVKELKVRCDAESDLRQENAMLKERVEELERDLRAIKVHLGIQ